MIQPLNPGRHGAMTREAYSSFVDSAGWSDFLHTAEEDIIKPMRAKALKDPALTEREQTGIVRALGAVRQLIELPYKKLAEGSGKKLEDVMPESVRRLFT